MPCPTVQGTETGRGRTYKILHPSQDSRRELRPCDSAPYHHLSIFWRQSSSAAAWSLCTIRALEAWACLVWREAIRGPRRSRSTGPLRCALTLTLTLATPDALTPRAHTNTRARGHPLTRAPLTRAYIHAHAYSRAHPDNHRHM